MPCYCVHHVSCILYHCMEYDDNDNKLLLSRFFVIHKSIIYTQIVNFSVVKSDLLLQ